MNQTWKPICGYEGLYEINEEGHVRRIGAWTDGRKNRIKGLRARTVSENGYCRITLFRDRTKKTFPVHRLVYESFIGPVPEGKQINHKDGNKTNNTPENLEVVTPSENQFHAYRILKVEARKGSQHHAAKVREDDVHAMRALRRRGWQLKEIAKEFGLSVPTVCWIVKNKSWNHI
jgi:hypothetical protein